MNLASTPTRERIFTLDVMRGFALLGILTVNIPSFSASAYYLEYIPSLHQNKGVDFYLLIFYHVFGEGKMRGLFTLLFGAGIILVTSEKERNGLSVADYYYRRMLWLLAFGLADAYLLLWRGDILYEYALIGMLLFAFRNLRARYLLLIGTMALCFFTWKHGIRFTEYQDAYFKFKKIELFLKKGAKLSEEQKKDSANWKELTFVFPPWQGKDLASAKERIKQEELNYRRSYSEMFTSFKGDNAAGQSSEFYANFWESLGTILLGMGLFKIGFLTGGFSKKFYALVALAGMALGLVLLWKINYQFPQALSDYTKRYEERSYSAIYPMYLGRLFLVLSYAAGIVLLCKINFLNWLKRLFANTGKMALTNYVMQTLICSTLFYGIGLGLFGKLRFFEIMSLVPCIFVVQMTYSSIWLRYFSMGPLEWLWRSLIYRKFLPNRITRTEINPGL